MKHPVRKLIVLGAVVLLMVLALAAAAAPLGQDGAQDQAFPGKRAIEVDVWRHLAGAPDNHLRRLDHRGGSGRHLQRPAAGTRDNQLRSDHSGRGSGDLGRNPAGTVTPNLSTDSRYGTPTPAP